MTLHVETEVERENARRTLQAVIEKLEEALLLQRERSKESDV
jgi:hypothetical protein